VLYDAFVQGRQSPLPELTIQYCDYVMWQREQVRDGAAEPQFRYWREQLRQWPDALDFPMAQKGATDHRHEGAAVNFVLEPRLMTRLQLLSKQQGVTLFMTLLAA